MLKKKLNILAIFVTLFLFAAGVKGEVPTKIPTYRFQRISIESGLSQSTINCIFQDYKGFMWFGTEDGLNRYDGYEFEVYSPETGNPNSIKGTFIYCIFEDSSGGLWIGTREGLNRYRRKSNDFQSFTKTPGGLSGSHIMAVGEDRNQRLWIATARNGLNKYNLKTGEFKTYRRDINDPGSVCSDNLNAIFFDSNGELWIGSSDEGLDRYDRENDRFIHYRHQLGKNDSLSDNCVLSIGEGPDGYIWVGTVNGLNRLEDETGTFTRYFARPGDPKAISDNSINAIHTTPSGILLIGTENGLNIFNSSEKSFTSLYNIPYDSESISTNLIRSIYEGPFGVLWIGTDGGGINSYAPVRYKFPLYRSNPIDEENNLNGRFVYSLFETKDHYIWIGTDKGLNRFDPKTRRFKTYSVERDDKHSLKSNFVFALHEDRNGNLWVGTWDGGLSKMNRETETFTHYLSEPGNLSSLSSNVVRVIYEDHLGVLWIGTEGGGVNRFDRDTEQFIHYQSGGSSKNLSNNHLTSIAEDQDGNLWFGTHDGLNLFDREKEEFIHYKADPQEPGSISNSSISTIRFSITGVMWVGTFGGGLNRYDSTTGKFTSFGKDQGLPDDVIYGILEDRQGNLWLSTNNGLADFNPQNNKIWNYYQRDGLQSNEFNQGASFVARDGRLMFGGIDGFNMFYPEQIVKNPHVPPIVVTNFKVLNTPVEIGPDSVLEQSITETEEIRLTYQDYVFSFDFAALDYSYPKANHYAYKMEGLDSEWTKCGTRRFASYTTLDPGEYTFRVRGSNNDGVWNDTGTSIHIVITPPFWLTWWFRILLAILLALLILGLFQYRTHNIRAQNKLLEEVNVKLNREVGERKQTEEKLKKSERRLRSFLQTASEGFLEVDSEAYIMDVNPEMCNILGREQDELIGSRVFDFLDPRGRETLKNELKLRRSGKKSSYELTMLQPDNVEVHCMVNATPIFDEVFNVKGSFALITDITEIIEAEEELKRTKRYLNDVLDSLSSMLLSIDQDGIITQWNRASEKFIDSLREKASVGKLWEAVPFLKPYRLCIEKVLSTRQPEELHKESILLDNGERKFLDIFIYPLIHRDLEGVVIRLDDVTELEKKDRQLLQAQKMEIVGNLAGGLAHDFNNVLGGIIGTISLLQFLLESEDPLDVENIKQRIATIENGAERAVDLVKQLLTLSRKKEPSFAPTDLNLALKHVVKICENTLDKSITIDVTFYEGRAMVWADATQVEQVLLNLSINAAHAMTIMREAHDPLGGKLTLSISGLHPDRAFIQQHPEANDRKYWCIEVADTGVGIDEKTVNMIFEPFYTTKTEQKGTGLGLSMVYHIVQQHRGFVTVYSEPSRGTSFRVYLPAQEKEESTQPQHKPKEQLVQGTGLILIVDDEQSLRDTSKEILRSCGYDVITAEDGKEGVETFMRHSSEISAVLMDMAMPVMSGRDAFIEMKKVDSNVKVLLASGFKQDKRVTSAINLGVRGFLQKPFTMMELSKKIAEVIKS